ncbi:T9SS type A sorting domain-containing protein [Psychroserpens sp.]
MNRLNFLYLLFFTISFQCYSQWVQKGETINHIGSFGNGSFGENLSLNADGTQIIIGDRFPSEAVVYEYIESSWVQKGNVLSDGTDSDRYGLTVAINDIGSIIAVGAPLSNLNGFQSGSLFIYSWDGNDWIQLGGTITGNSSDDQMANRSIGMSTDGLTIAVGSGHAFGDATRSGHVRVFNWNTSNNDWEQKGDTLNGQFNNGLAGEFVSLSADGNTMVYSDLTNEGGFVFVHYWDSTTNTWIQKGSTILGETDEGWTGASVELSADGNTVAYGAPLTNNETGLAKIYDFNGTDWIQRGVAILGEQEESRFGREVDLSGDGNLIFISGYAYDLIENNETLLDIGAASVYEWDGSEWVQKGNTFYGIEAYSRLGQLGTVISSDGSTIAYLQSENGLDGAYVFEFDSNLSVQDFNKKKQFIVYPNPIKNEFNIKLQTPSEGNWIIFNELGQNVMHGKLQGLETKINTQALVSGFYALKIKDENNTTVTVRKIVK